ncbi:MAG: hypothetical protein CBR30_09835 [Dictyoglomus sp. NZ13-RE01]|nr:MAG: hypothetical protein CBR30_09835 [Dictyoglomus sp. NZ13-RE01]
MECVETTLGRLCLGDARELIKTIPSESVGAVITDPPWGVKRDEYDDENALYDILPELYRVLKPGGALAVYYATKFLNKLIDGTEKVGFRYYWTIIRLDFSKATRSPFGSSNYTPAIIFYKAKPPKIQIKISDVIMAGEVDYDLLKGMTKEVFDQFKATTTTSYLVQSLTEEGGVVLDPFAGYGNIPYVAETHGRRWLAFEISKERYEIAKYLVLNKRMPKLK